MLNNALRGNVSFSGLTAKGTLLNGRQENLYFSDYDTVNLNYQPDSRAGYEYLLAGKRYQDLEIDTIDRGTTVHFANKSTRKPVLSIKTVKDNGNLIQGTNTKTTIEQVLGSNVVLDGNAISSINLLSNQGFLKQNDQSESNIKKVIGNARISLNHDNVTSENDPTQNKAKCKIEDTFDGSVLNNQPGHIQLELYDNSEMEINPEMQGKFRVYQYGNSLLNANKGMSTIFNAKSIFNTKDEDPDIAKITSRVDVNGNSRLVNSGSMKGRIDVNLHDTSNSDITNLTVKHTAGKDVKITQSGTSISDINALAGQLQLLNASQTSISKLHGLLDLSKDYLKKPTDEANDKWKTKNLSDNRSFANINKVEPAPLPVEAIIDCPTIVVDGHSKVIYNEGYPDTENRNKKFGLGSKIQRLG